jgi:ring-1,2-phenylacetyl-CoA epoxidase subunit PaaE
MASHQFYPLTVKEVSRNTKDCVIITFDIPDHLRDQFVFLAGQYLTCRASIQGEEVRRSYSICAAPESQTLAIGVKKIKGGKFSGYANDHLKAGDTLDCMPPTGNFTLKSNAPGSHVLFFAAGSGITPVMSQIRHLLLSDPKVTVTLIYGNRNAESIIFREALDDLKNTYVNRVAIHHVFSREKTGVPLLHGRLDKEKIRAMQGFIFDARDATAIMICGPATMIFAIKEALLEEGVAEKNIHFELFSTEGLQQAMKVTAPQLQPDDNHSSEISIQLDGDIFEFDLGFSGQNLLDAAIANGADLPYSCKGGVCSTCKARVVEGDVVMDVNFALEPEEVEAGYVLLCQAHPRSERVFIDFDQK